MQKLIEILESICANKIDEVRFLTESQAHFDFNCICNIKPYEGKTLLHEARSKEMVDFLVSHGSNIHAIDLITNNTPLDTAILKNRGVVIIALLEEGAFSQLSIDFNKCLLDAVAVDNVYIVKRLLDWTMYDIGRSVSIKNIHQLWNNVRSIEMANILIGNDIPNNKLEQEEKRHLMKLAFTTGLVALATALLQNGVSLPSSDDQNVFILYLARKSNIDAVKQLQSEGFNISNTKITTLDSVIIQPELFEYLVDQGLNIQGQNGLKLLSSAFVEYAPKIIEILIKHGVKLQDIQLPYTLDKLIFLEPKRELTHILLRNGFNFSQMKGITPLINSLNTYSPEEIVSFIKQNSYMLGLLITLDGMKKSYENLQKELLKKQKKFQDKIRLLNNNDGGKKQNIINLKLYKINESFDNLAKSILESCNATMIPNKLMFESSILTGLKAAIFFEKLLSTYILDSTPEYNDAIEDIMRKNLFYTFTGKSKNCWDLCFNNLLYFKPKSPKLSRSSFFDANSIHAIRDYEEDRMSPEKILVEEGQEILLEYQNKLLTLKERQFFCFNKMRELSEYNDKYKINKQKRSDIVQDSDNPSPNVGAYKRV